METKIIIDNATLAASGRATYRQRVLDLDNEAKTHIETYGANYPASLASDVVSLSELISALVLYDNLIWNRGSFVEESKDQFTGNRINENCWVYHWFPDFKIAYHYGVLCPFRDVDDDRQQQRAQDAAMDWVRRKYSSFLQSLPSDFKVPEAYKSKKYHYFEDFQRKNSLYKLDDDELAVAMFTHRELFYLSQTHNRRGVSYLPHGNRATFLIDDELSLHSYIVSSKLFKTQMYGTSASDIKKKIEDIVKSKRSEAIGTIPLELNSVGGTFIHKYGVEHAFKNALQFRQTKKGAEIRELFHSLVDAGSNSNNITVTTLLDSLKKEVDDVIKSKLGGNISDTINRVKFLGIPNWAAFALQYLSVNVQSSIVRKSNTILNPSGFQMIFSNYID